MRRDIASEWHVGGSEAPTPRGPEPQRGQRLSEALVPNPRPKTAPGMRDIQGAPRRPAAAWPVSRPPSHMTIAIREEKETTPREPEKAAPREDAPLAPKKILHPEVDIDALKRAITESLKKKDAGEEGK